MNLPLADLNVDFLIPRPLKGSGGHRTIYRNAGALQDAGARVRLHFEHGGSKAKTQAEKLFEVGTMSLQDGWPSALPGSDLLFATTWQSAWAVAAVDTTAIKAHFVQDYECWFYPRGDDYLDASRAHDLGLRSIGIGEWLPRVLWREHGLPALSIPFTAELDRYKAGPVPRPARKTRQVVAMYQPEKPRRCPELMSAALSRVLESEPGVEVVTVGSRWSPRLGERHRHLGVVGPDELAGLYRDSDVGLSISASNPSRVPFEMMASGLPVVEVGGENTIFDLPEAGCLLAEPDAASLSGAICGLLEEPELSERKSQGGVEFMRDRPASDEQTAFVDAVRRIIAGEITTEPAGSPRYESKFIKAPETTRPGRTGRSWAQKLRRLLIQLGF